MFTWICPTCGRECPPSYTECPDCAGKEQPGTAAAPAPAAEPAAPAVPAARAAAPAAQPPLPRARKSGLPTWLMSLIFACIFFVVGAGAYLGYQRYQSRPEVPAAAQESPFEAPPAAAPGATGAPAAASPYLKYLEVTGWRLLQDARKRPEARFVVVNHSGAEMVDLSVTVSLRAVAGQESEPAGSLSFKIASLGPYESRDMTAPLETRLKVYEFPDWQNLAAQVSIAAPQAR